MKCSAPTKAVRLNNMLKTLPSNLLSILIFAIFLVLLFTSPSVARSKATIRIGMTLPELALIAPTDKQELDYLGLEQNVKTFTFSEINTSLLLIEFFNTHCPHCQEQAPVYAELFHDIAEDPKLNSQIKMIGITVGNSAQEITDFSQRHNIPFPLFADNNFTIWRAINGKASPFTVIVQQNGTDMPSVVYSTHTGVNRSCAAVLNQLKQFLKMTPEEFKILVAAEIKNLPPEPEPFSQAALESDVLEAFGQLGRVTGLRKIDLQDEENVYTALVHRNRKANRCYAQIVHRETACDLCHDIYFIYLFDTTGSIVAIAPLSLSKLGNKQWNDKDIKKLKHRLIGRNLLQPQPFDPTVDAITSATISSAMIFDSIANGKNIYKALQDLPATK